MRNSTTINSDEVMNDAFIDLVDYYDKRLIVMYGGAGSGKSVASAQIIVMSMLQGRNQLIVRKVARTLKRSVFSEVLKALDQLEVADLFKINYSDMTIRCQTGSVAYFVGCDDAEKLKSITPPSGMFNDVHIEEATEISEDDFLLIDSRQRGDSKLPRRMFLRFNPIRQSHWIKRELFDSGKYECLFHKTTCEDNKFLSDIDKQRYRNYKDQSDYMYNVYYLGNWGVIGGVIFDYSVATEKPERLTGIKPTYGLDFGWNNPSAIVRVYSDDSIIYVDEEIYQKELTNERLAELAKRFTEGSIIYCDSAEPKSIQKLRSLGVSALPVKKGAGSVLSGIRYIQGKKLIVNQSCVNLINELDSYHFKKDKNGEVMEVPELTDDHAIDALRYALEEKMNQSETVIGYPNTTIGWQ